MRTNVFLRSTRRQPVRAALLLLVTALVTFTFVGRASEYLLIRQETERLGSFYRSIGTLAGPDEAVSQAETLLRESPYVGMTDQARYGSAILADMYNADGTDTCKGLLWEDTIFCGTLEYAFAGTIPVSGGEQVPFHKFTFTVDKVLTGYPEVIEEGDTIVLITPSHYTDHWHLKKAYDDLTEVYEEMKIGQRYLVRGVYDSMNNQNGVKSLAGTRFSTLTFKQLIGADGLWFYPAEAGQNSDFSAPALAGLAEEIEIINDNQHALATIASQDVSALAEVWQGGRKPYLLDGRWPDSTDNEQRAYVCAVSKNFAKVKGVSVGDHINMSLRDLYRCYYGSLYDPIDIARLGNIAVSEVRSYEIVGVFDAMEHFWLSPDYQPDQLFIPASVVPENFEYGYVPTDFQYGVAEHNTDHFFMLTSPAVEDAFCSEMGDTLSKLGVEVEILETGWDNFQNAAGPMRQSSLSSAAVFTGVLLAALSLAAFLYYRMRRGDFAKARALGLPAVICARQSALPLLLIGAAGTAAGGVLGWRYTQDRAGETLRSLAEFGELSDGLSPWWLLALWAASFALLSVLAAFGAVLLARKPVLSLLQGGAVQKAPKKQEAAPAIQVSELDLSLLGQVIGSVPGKKKGTGAAHVLRFVWRHIWRMPVKSGLAVALAAGFMIGLAAIQTAIATGGEKIDGLYNSTVVTMDLVEDGFSAVTLSAKKSGFVSADTVRAIQETGFVRDAYLEGANDAAVVPYDGQWVRGEAVSLQSADMVSTRAASFDNLAEFLEKSDSELEVTFLPGWDESLFAQDWAALDAETSDEDPALFPVVLPKALYEGYGLQPGDTVGVSCGSFRVCEVAGYYEGSAREFNTALLLPNSAAEAITGDRMNYLQAHFELDPARNRELDQFRVELDGILEAVQGRGATLRALLWDEELTEAVAPLEESLQLMRILYPVVFVLSLLTVVGTAALFVLMSAKDAATLRVLGTPRGRARLILILQQAVTCFAGLVLGVAGILAYINQVRPELLEVLAGAAVWRAAAYLAAAVFGAAVSSAAVTNKNPLEMLQVKE